MDKKERVEYCQKEIKKIQDDMTALNDHRETSISHFNAVPSIVKLIKGRSEITTTDFADSVNQVKAYILSTLMDADEVKFPAEGPEDVDKMEKLSLVANKHIRQKNNWFLVLNDFLDDTLRFKFGVIKVQFRNNKKHVYRELRGLSEEELQAALLEPSTEIVELTENVESEAIKDDEGNELVPAVSNFDVLLRVSIDDEYNLIESVPSEDVGFPIDTRDINESFFYHRIGFKEGELKKYYGEDVVKKVKKLRKQFSDNNHEAIKSARLRDLGANFLYNDKKEEYVVYECYYRDIETGDPVICTICGGEEVSFSVNKYGSVPFVVATPYKMGHLVIGQDLLDNMKSYHKIRTTIFRQIFDNAYQANFRRYFVDYTRVNMKDYLDTNTTNTAIRVEGDPQTAVMPEIKAQLPDELFRMWELINLEKDYHAPVPRSFTGAAPQTMNKTFRGLAQQMTQAAQKLDMITRTIAEMAIIPLYVKVGNNISRFMQKSTWVSVLNEFVEINPAEIETQADYATVNIGIGTRNKDMIVANVQQLLGIYKMAYEAGLPVVSVDNVYHALRSLVKNMGFKDVDNWTSNPKLMETMKSFVMEVMKFVQQGQQMGIPQDQKIMQLVQMLAQMLNIQPPQPQMPENGGGNQPMQPMQPMQPRMTPDMEGGSFFA